MSGRWCSVFLAVVVGSVAAANPAFVHAADDAPKPEPKGAVPANPFPNRVPATELEGGVEWLNSSGPISLRDLRGKVVLLDFWTFCCINCMHVLPDLAFLEEKYANELVVIGVHSAKFDNEKQSGNIRKAILRYEIAHPVVNDAEMTIWRKFGVRSWPTLVVIDPEGNYCGYVSGEGNREILDKVIGKLVAYHKAKGTLDETPVHFDLERQKTEPTPLRFPGKLLVDEASKRLFISDSNHNRIVISSLDGQLIDVIGSGTIGAKDGGYAEAQFDHPQGMCLIGNQLYVADTENHMLRVVDLDKKQVTTFAGTGEQAHFRASGGALRTSPLNSPWDVLHLDGVLYVAMAGPHQIWAHRLSDRTIQPYAGSGREDITNGSLSESALAQPSGLATDGHFIFVVDSEGSAVRKISTRENNNLHNPKGTVTTIAGTSDLPGGRSLFEFGDVDGVGGAARLQHPLGIVFHNDTLFVADSYNHKIKQIDPKSGNTTTWFAGAAGDSGLTPPKLNEPAGLAIAGQTMFVADTNQHRICAIDLNTKAAREFTIAGLTPPAPPAATDESGDAGETVALSPQRVAAEQELAFEAPLDLPVGYKLNPGAPVVYRLTAAADQSLIAKDELGVRDEADVQDNVARFRVPLAAKSGQATLRVEVHYTYCRDGASGLCKLGSQSWTVPIELATDATAKVVRLAKSE